ncbi:NAD(P)/FAD-dependent oxidoreductase [Candidatus Bathyarchaeota archaeon]|nr:MAG: NAD(P)/FAD-dependent oxidoreductase [Candidatus Bathyarchaeota archaeon]
MSNDAIKHNMDRVDAVIVGAGVVGLAIGAEIARSDREIYILEKETSYGQATSSRNSEVIHAGIYYPKGSLKAELCVEANPMIYEICREHRIPHKRLGKIIVANGEAEVKQLEEILKNARECGARDLELIDADDVHKLEPNVKADAAILSPTTGIIDAHGLMDHYHNEARRKSGADPLALDTEVTGLRKTGDGYEVEMVSGGEQFSVEARVVINSAGLHADSVAAMAGIDIDQAGYRIHWCKGDYFSLTGKPPASMLVYPPPPKDAASLGIHTVPDLTGRLKFGPNAYYVDEIGYGVESSSDEFWRDIVNYLPTIRKEDLHPDMSGIRAKLQGPGDPVRDFVITHEEDRGYPGLINLVGIESPGLTSAPTIAEMVGKWVDELL